MSNTEEEDKERMTAAVVRQQIFGASVVTLSLAEALMKSGALNGEAFIGALQSWADHLKEKDSPGSMAMVKAAIRYVEGTMAEIQSERDDAK